MTRNILIIGAAGRDFHNFNTFYKHNSAYRVVGFTASTQVPGIAGRKYPAEFAGPLYPDGISIFAETELSALIKHLSVDECVFAYSDVSYQYVMDVGSIVAAAGASYRLMGPNDTMIKSTKPVIAVCAVRTGAGKSQTSRRVAAILMRRGLKVVVVRHPMPYGNLLAQKVQRFAELADLKKHKCTVEEIEEYEPHVVQGNVIYAGVDYEGVLRAAEQDSRGCDVILWDGGNNDYPFFTPDLLITVADPLRAGHELTYYPGATNLRMADVVVINKIDSALPDDVQRVQQSVHRLNPDATVVYAASPIRVDHPSLIQGKRVLVIGDGPTLTHGEMKASAGIVAAKRFRASEIVDPRPYTVGQISDTFKLFPDIGTQLPAMGYGEEQLKDLETTINRTECDTVIVATPIDLTRLIKIEKPYTRVYYDLQEIGLPNLEDILSDFTNLHKLL